MNIRENMPDISAGAHKALSERPEYNRQYFNQKQKEINIETCKTCNKEYNQAEVEQLMTSLPILLSIDYDNRCLKCIKEACQHMKVSYQPDLKKSKEELTKLTIIYQKAHNQHNALAKEYQELDYQANMINLHLINLVKKTKAATPKKKKTEEQIKKATALKILGNLTDDQQKALLAIINKQGKA